MDLTEARRMALAAVSGARGYANYLLGCISLREKQPSQAAKYFRESIKTGFTPAATHLASIVVHGTSGEGKQKAIDLLRKSVSAGHLPAFLILARVYLSVRSWICQTITGAGSTSSGVFEVFPSPQISDLLHPMLSDHQIVALNHCLSSRA